MGLSFHDESSMVKASIGSLRFAPDIPNPVPENGISDDLDIQMVDRWIIEIKTGRIHTKVIDTCINTGRTVWVHYFDDE